MAAVITISLAGVLRGVLVVIIQVRVVGEVGECCTRPWLPLTKTPLDAPQIITPNPIIMNPSNQCT